MNEEKLFYTLALQNVEGVGDVIAKRLLSHFKDAKAVLKASTVDLMQVDGVGDRLLKNLRDKNIYQEAEMELNAINKLGIQVSFYTDDDYPGRLKHCDDGPVLLYSTRRFDWKNSKIISIVGTRRHTSQGKEFCQALVAGLAIYNPIIVSGFAFGIDIIAHKAAVDNQLRTVGVLGHGLQDVYPRSHYKYMEIIKELGGFLSEFKTRSSMERENFIRRNRIVAGLSEATVIVESAQKGGSMSTARFANDYNREVFAVPGRVTDKYSQGCNELIKWQRAQLITSAQDVIDMLQWDGKGVNQGSGQRAIFVELSEEEQKIYDYLAFSGKRTMDEIALACQLVVYKVGVLLLSMELKGVIRPMPGKVFELI